MSDPISGVHHVTAIASDPGENVEFYTDVLGLRLVKRTVNFDDVTTYHLYYGDERGTPGTILTFFPFVGSGRGRVGRGQATATAFVVPDGALEYWVDRFDDYGVDRGEIDERFGDRMLGFVDSDGQPLELLESENDVEPWSGGSVPPRIRDSRLPRRDALIRLPRGDRHAAGADGVRESRNRWRPNPVRRVG